MKKATVFNKNQKGEIIDIFAEAFHEVVVPVLETLATKKDIEKIDERLDKLDDRIEKVDHKIFTITDNHSDKLDNLSHHQADNAKRIKKLEAKITSN